MNKLIAFFTLVLVSSVGVLLPPFLKADANAPLPDNHINETPPVPKQLPTSKAYKLFTKENFSDRFTTHILTVSKNKNVDPVLVYAVMKQESQFKLRAKSNAGACGALQVMPFHFGNQAKNCSEPYLNVNYGVGILADCLEKAGGNLKVALSLYNSGRKNGYLRFPETRYYVSKITSDYYNLKGSKNV